MSERRYVVRGKVAKDAPQIGITAGTEVWLTYSREAGGWFDWAQREASAFPFESEEKASAESKSNGPWYLVPDPASIEVLEADYEPPRAASIQIVRR